MASQTPAAAASPCTSAAPPHPLELIPLFRRWKPGFWRDIVYTFIWNTLIALIFCGFALLFEPRISLFALARANFVFAQCIGFSIHVLFALGDLVAPRVHDMPFGTRLVYYTCVPIVGVLLGYWIGARWLGYDRFLDWMFTARGLGQIGILVAIISGVMSIIFVQRERAARAEATIAVEQARVAAAEREAAMAQMKALEAQVEPHFLYNTLAHVASLIGTDANQARQMLDRLIALLRSTAKAGGDRGTLGSQVALLRAYLDILAMRMGPRLAWSIDVPPALEAAVLPPALLQPLIENAIKHGLEPNVEGGRIDVTARAVDDMIEIIVADTGAGFGSQAPLGGSTKQGLSVLKQRLTALFGTAAALTLVENRPHGIRAILRVPLRTVETQ
ncbi:MAG TPA: histidine kinase [Casimicrobiaceae bacterium]|nr:histidine kinase [Casimicrobiaceae bacterium]